MIKDWSTYPDGKEKYQLYLASREWAVKKEAVKARSKGTCERCVNAPGQQVHHQTYERKYRELLGDLVHLCVPCHEFVSGKRHDDPIRDAPFVLFGKKIFWVYLAGKITGDSWRDEIAPGWLGGEGSFVEEVIEDCHNPSLWGVAKNVIPTPGGQQLGLTGPFWIPLDGYWNSHGNGWPPKTGGVHRYGEFQLAGKHSDRDFSYTKTGPLFGRIRNAIDSADLVFAWIDRLDCYGTLVEIGLASAMGKLIVVAIPRRFDFTEIWIALTAAYLVFQADSPSDAWNQLLKKTWYGFHDHREITTEEETAYQPEAELIEAESDSEGPIE